MELERHATEAEQVVLGSLLLYGWPALEGCRAAGLRAGDFYQPRHEELYHALLLTIDRKDVTSPTAFLASLSSEQTRKIGGADYLPVLLDRACVAPETEHYARLVVSAAQIRQVASAAAQMTRLAETAPLDEVPTLLERVRDISDGLLGPEERSSMFGPLDAFQHCLDALEHPPDGVSTGFPDLDDLLGGGLKPGRLVVVGARTNVGKTMLATNMMRACWQQEVPTVMFTLEMDHVEIVNRMLSAVTAIDHRRLEKHQVDSAEESRRLAEAVGRFQNVPWRIIDADTLSIGEMRGRLRLAERELPRRRVRVVFVDYLQRVIENDSGMSREQQVARISSGLKAMARAHRCSVVALAQVNRSPESRRNNAPMLIDLRESGAIENDADAVILMNPEPDGTMRLHLAKNRHGTCGDVHIMWSPDTQRAGSLYRHPEDPRVR